MAMHANEHLRDAAARNAVFTLRFAEAEARQIIRLLNDADRDLVEIIRERLASIKSRGFDTGPATTTRLQKLLVQIRESNAAIYAGLQAKLVTDLSDLAGAAADGMIESLDVVIGADLGLLRPAPSVLRSAVTSDPFRGKVMKDWFRDLSRSKIEAIRQAINIGIVQGQTNDEIVRRLVGTRTQGFKDGIFEIHRRHATTVTRTAAIHTNARARDLVYEANKDIIAEVQWVSTLDGRTTEICQGLDGQTFPVGEGPRPPAHPNCRSTTVPVTKSWAQLSKNGALTPGRGSTNMQTLFDQKLAEQGFTQAQIRQIGMNTRASMNGQVAGKLSYGDWLRRQPPGFIEDVLGPVKAKLFTDGGLNVDRFVDFRSGRPFTIDELRRREADAWKKAFGSDGS